MDKFVESEYLDDRCWSHTWEFHLQQALPYDPLRVGMISAIIPIPESKAVLIFTEECVYRSESNGLEVLNQLSAAQCFPDYGIMSACLRSLKCFGRYKFPWICPYFTLFPIESPERTTWINPLMVYCLQVKNNIYYAKMENGLNLVLPLQKKAFLKRADVACSALATVRRDLFRFSVKSHSPTDYIDSTTPFYRHLLLKSSSLQQFPLQPGAFSRHYAKAHFLHHYDKLDQEPHMIDWRRW